jgi:hypothetical protein|tara:strand:+ start:8 stop:670 length:663 start_codon:yes stop_codon:yes gene_type:complete
MAIIKITDQSLASDAVTTAKVLDNNVTLAKLGDGTQGDILYYGASGAPTRLGFGTSGDFLKTQGTGANPVWATAGGANTPAFAATFSGTTATVAGTWTKVPLATEVFDTDGDYDKDTNYRFTPTTSGKFYIYGHCWCYMQSTATQSQRIRTVIYKNGVEVDTALVIVDLTNTDTLQACSQNVTTIQDANGSSDYFELYVKIDDGAAYMYRGEFGGYKVII